jgi:SEC-C motif-containing protein
MRCPCRKKSEVVAYGDCCEPYHAGVRAAPTAEALMRSRYSAFALEKADYILASWHPSTRPERIEFTPGLEQWLMLKVIGARENGDEGEVEFVARSRIGGRAHELHEVSRFVREAGRWLYVSGRVG